tara:strand:- start:234 stop:488 length:255 start_codon:yes stop_codon:yes gene_type:complete
MGRKFSERVEIMKLTKEQKLELEKAAAEIEAEAERMRIDYEENPSEESGEVDTENNLVRGSGIEIDLDTYDPDSPLGMPTEEEE